MQSSLNESEIWASAASEYLVVSLQDPLSSKFPELMRANGSVDTNEAIVALLDRIKELDERVKQLGN